MPFVLHNAQRLGRPHAVVVHCAPCSLHVVVFPISLRLCDTIEWHPSFPWCSLHRRMKKNMLGLILDFLIETHERWSTLSICINGPGVVLCRKCSSLTTADAIVMTA